MILFLMATELKEGEEVINSPPARQRLGSALEILVKPELKKQKMKIRLLTRMHK